MLQKAPRNALLPCHSFPMDRHLSAAVDPRPADGLLGSGSSCTSMARHPPCTTSIRNSGRRLKCWLCPARHGTGKGRHASPAETVPQSAARFRQAFSGASLSGPAIAGPADVRPACRLAGSAVPAMAGTVYGAAYGQHGIVPGQGLALCRTLRRGVMLWAACAAFLGVRCRVSWSRMQGLSRGMSRFLAGTRSTCRRLSGQPVGWPGGMSDLPIGSTVLCCRLAARCMVPEIAGAAYGAACWRHGVGRRAWRHPQRDVDGRPCIPPADRPATFRRRRSAPPQPGAGFWGRRWASLAFRPLAVSGGGLVRRRRSAARYMVPAIAGTVYGAANWRHGEWCLQLQARYPAGEFAGGKSGGGARFRPGNRRAGGLSGRNGARLRPGTVYGAA